MSKQLESDLTTPDQRNLVLARLDTIMAWAFLVQALLVVAAAAFTLGSRTSFFGEEGLMTVLSTLTLAFTAFSAWLAGFFSENRSGSQEARQGRHIENLWWYLAGFFLLYLSFDEILQLHESGGLLGGILFLMTGKDLPISTAEAATIGIYGSVAILIALNLRGAFQKDHRGKLLILGAASMIITSLAVDAFFWPFVTVAVEDGSKQLGYFFLFVAILRQAMANIGRFVSLKISDQA